MLRTTITKNHTEKDKLVLMTNQNFFIRTAIANVAKIILASIILAGIIIVLSLIGTNVVVSSTDTTSPIILYAFMIISYIVYLAYFIATISEIVTLYKKSTAIENQILGGENPSSETKTKLEPTPIKPSEKEDEENDL